jgi:glycolate oxidase
LPAAGEAHLKFHLQKGFRGIQSMEGESVFKSHAGVGLDDFRALPRDRAAALVREQIADLLHFFSRKQAHRASREPARVENLAAGLEAALLGALPAGDPREARSLGNRILIDGFTRSEFDRDQNVYLGHFYTRVLTRAVPDLVFQPATYRELEVALAWAQREGLRVTTRGAGSTAMGGAVPNDGGLLLDMSRFDAIQVDAGARVAVIGAGARLKQIHEKLAAAGLALKTYPSNLGGTLAGWFSAGGLGLNSFKHGPVQNQVRTLAAVLPRGEHVRFHDDGRLDVPGPEEKSQRLTPEQADEWLRAHKYPHLRLEDFAQTEGQFGVLLTFTMELVPLPRHATFYFEFGDEEEALRFVHWVADAAAPRRCPPADLKYLSPEHVAAVRAVRGDAARPARPAVYVDFDDPEEGARFEAGLDTGKWNVRTDAAEAARWFGDRFRPQQTKRLGPGFLAAEILLPAQHVARFLERARHLAARVGIHLESEVYFFGDGRALALPGYLSRGPRPGFIFELVFAPMLVDLAMRRYDGQPYVLGRWQSPFFRTRFRSGEARTLRRVKKSADPHWTLNPGVYFRPAFRIPGVTTLFRWSFPAGLRFLRGVYGAAPFAPIIRGIIGRGALPAHGRVHDTPELQAADRTAVQTAATLDALAHSARTCVNCGECNSVCPIFHDAKIRLPQMLTHIGEKMVGTEVDGSRQLLLDLCMRCGNCEQVCQAGIPHLALYAAMETRAGAYDAPRRERHTAILAHLRNSERYLRDFLGVRPGGYVNRTPASLPGDVRWVLFRAENDAGPADTCIHCGACVPVCPTSANLEYEHAPDVRRITTDLGRCIGCGTCVEVCPANHQNGGRTLRVMEAPNREFFAVLEAFEGRGR